MRQDRPELKLLRIVFALFLALSLAVPAAARDWLRADTPGFIIYSDGYPQETERWARKIEAFDALLRQRYVPRATGNGARLTIYLLADQQSVARLVGQEHLTGFYSTTSEGSFAIATRKPAYYKDQLSGQMSIFHEYAHHFMYRHFPAAYPAWYREGFAEYVSTVTFDMDWNWAFALPAGHRERQLRKDPLPIGTILFSNVGDFKPKHRARFYAWSWLLVHMLESRPDRTAELHDYLDRFGNGAGPREAARAFGDLGALQRDLQAYAETQLSFEKSSEPLVMTADIRVTALDPLQSQLVELDLARKVKRDPEGTRDALRSLAQAYPASADVQFELALIERDIAKSQQDGDFTLAEAAADRALAANPHHVRANVLWAELAIRRLTGNPAATPADWAGVRARLADAIHHDPDDQLALMTLFRSYLAEGKRPPDLAFAAIRKAFALEPESTQIRLAYAYALAFRGQFKQAQDIARVLAYDPHASDVGSKALARLQALEARATRTRPSGTEMEMGTASGE